MDQRNKVTTFRLQLKDVVDGWRLANHPQRRQSRVADRRADRQTTERYVAGVE